MSAGNPFRRSRVPVVPDPSSANIFDVARDAPEEAAPTTTLHRREPERHQPYPAGDSYSLRNGDRGGVPEGDVNIDESGSEDESTTPALNQDSRDSGRGGTAGGTRAPYNPFARTLATQDADLGSLGKSRDAEATRNEQRTKQALDVDAFKNILMNGAPVPASASTNASTARPHHSNMDNLPAFDSTDGDRPDSPRGLYHQYDSPSEDDEESELMGGGRSDDLAPPAPPKAKTKGPQTVSFADFDQSIPPGFMSSRSRSPQVSAQHITGILRTASPRPGSDLNKPLPPPPQDTGEKFKLAVSDENRPPSRAIVQSPAMMTSVKSVPPPPPTRKSGVGHGRVRSGSNLSNVSTQDPVMSTPQDFNLSNSSNKLAPPPPPTRKFVHPTTAQPETKETISPMPEAKLIPPPPPPLRRLPSKAGRNPSSLGRQGSEDAANSSATIATAAPPPPPPRRPGSKRTSLDGAPSSFQRRLSGEHYRGTSFDSERSASISSLHKVAETSEGGEQVIVSPGTERDILAEMSAFQAEIDALSQAAKGK